MDDEQIYYLSELSRNDMKSYINSKSVSYKYDADSGEFFLFSHSIDTEAEETTVDYISLLKPAVWAIGFIAVFLLGFCFLRKVFMGHC